MNAGDDGVIVLAGAGKMGAALLTGWIERGIDPKRLIIQDPAPSTDLAALIARHAIRCETAVAALSTPPSIVIVAVKPQVIDQVFPALGRLCGPNTVTLSIAAGKSLASFERHLPPQSAVVRAMPNTPASIGRGITGVIANRHTTSEQRALCDRLLSAVGDVVWLEDEQSLDAVTAVSGSGPAYVFLLVEVMAEAGRRAGLDADVAARLARQTVAGAGEMLVRATTDPAILRQNVTSPGGTTAAALAVLMREPDGLQSLMTAAIEAAQKRGRELGQ